MCVRVSLTIDRIKIMREIVETCDITNVFPLVAGTVRWFQFVKPKPFRGLTALSGETSTSVWKVEPPSGQPPAAPGVGCAFRCYIKWRIISNSLVVRNRHEFRELISLIGRGPTCDPAFWVSHVEKLGFCISHTCHWLKPKLVVYRWKGWSSLRDDLYSENIILYSVKNTSFIQTILGF